MHVLMIDTDEDEAAKIVCDDERAGTRIQGQFLYICIDELPGIVVMEKKEGRTGCSRNCERENWIRFTTVLCLR